ncbi:hypothetical protein QQ045_030233 [Rhodiola kirilowii]
MGNSFGWAKQVVRPLEGMRVSCPETGRTSFRVKVRMPASRFKELARKSRDGSELGSLILRECMEGENRCSIIPCLNSEPENQSERSLSTINEEKNEALYISKKIE